MPVVDWVGLGWDRATTKRRRRRWLSFLEYILTHTYALHMHMHPYEQTKQGWASSGSSPRPSVRPSCTNVGPLSPPLDPHTRSTIQPHHGPFPRTPQSINTNTNTPPYTHSTHIHTQASSSGRLASVRAGRWPGPAAGGSRAWRSSPKRTSTPTCSSSGFCLFLCVLGGSMDTRIALRRGLTADV